jgi:hypothetical protein
MPSSKRSRTPPAAPAARPAASRPAVVPVPSLRETFTRRHAVATALIILATIPGVLAPLWDTPAQTPVIAVAAVVALTISALIWDREQWIAYARRQMLLTLGFGALAALTAPAVPVGLILPMLFASVLEYKRGWGGASALVLGAGVAYAVFGINPVSSYPYVLGMAWPAIGANVMRRLALAGRPLLSSPRPAG